MKIILIAMLALISSNSFAGLDFAKQYKCDNGEFKLLLKEQGDFSGENRIKLSHSGLFGKRIINEKHDGYFIHKNEEVSTDIEKQIAEENPINSELAYGKDVVVKGVKSASTLVIITDDKTALTNFPEEKGAFYVQLNATGEVIKFERSTECN